MSEATPHVENPSSLPREKLGLVANVFLVIGAFFLVLTAYGAHRHPHYFAFAWLWAFIYFFSISVGALFWVALHHVTNSGWGILIRRQAENLAWSFRFLWVLFIPILWYGPELYPWLTPAHLVDDPAFAAKQAYFTFPFCPVPGSFYYVRTFLYFAFFLGTILYFRSLSLRQDVDGSPVHTIKMRKFAAGFFPFFGVMITLVAFDWLMSLDFHWYSTLWGVYVFTESVCSSMALLILIFLAFKYLGYFPSVTREHFHIMGKLLFAFNLFWSYIAYSQYMLIWYANIPEETSFFHLRNVGSWSHISWGLLFCGFAIPFLMLLPQDGKKNPWRIGFTAGWMLTMHAVDQYWIIMPYVQPTGWSPHWIECAAWLGIASIYASFFLRVAAATPLYPIRDPRLVESLAVSN